jgi:hypothetical protein
VGSPDGYLTFKEPSVANLNRLKPGIVVKRIQKGLGNPKINKNGRMVDKFNMNVHMLCWIKYKARPEGGSPTPDKTDTRYCTYDDVHKDYTYNQAWVDFLIGELKDENKFKALY